MDLLWKFKIRILSLNVTILLLACISCSNLLADIETLTEKPSLDVAATVKKSGSKVLQFNKLTIDDGLTTSEIKSVAQDTQGYIWIGTPAGLNRYDGSTVKQYQNSPSNKNSLSNNLVSDIEVDASGQIWVATADGLNRFNPINDNFTIYRKNQSKGNSLNSNAISSLFVDSKKQLWVGTRSGFSRYVSSTDSFINYQHDSDSPSNSFRKGKVNTFFEDNNGLLWIGTTSGSHPNERGVTLFDPEAENFTHFDHDPNDDTSLQKGSVKTIFQSADKRVWVSTYNGGLSEYLPLTQSFKKVIVPGSLLKRISNVLVDSRGVIWLLTQEKGLLIFDPHNYTFTSLTKDADNPYGLSSKYLTTIFEDREGLLWIGTNNIGLNIFDYKTQRFNHILPGKQIEEFTNSQIRSIDELSDGTILLGSSHQGLVVYDPIKNTFVSIFEEFINGYSTDRASGVIQLEERKVLVGTTTGVYTLDLDTHEKHLILVEKPGANNLVNIVKIYKANDGLYWLLSAGKGLFSLNLETEEVIDYPFASNDAAFDESMLSSYYPRDIFEDEEGFLWIATIKGLNRFDRRNNTFKHYVHDSESPESLPENKIYKILEEDNQRIWLATNNGLILFDKVTEKFRRFTMKDGLSNNTIYCMEMTEKYLWLGTNAGISRWHRKNFTAINYYREDGLQSNEYNTYGCSIGDSGNLYFAGINGLNYFKADEVSLDNVVAPLLITELKLEDAIMPFFKDSTVEIPYDNSFVQLEFRALSYSGSARINYQIKLENFDKEWRDIGSKNNTVYTNLPAGEYLFKVKTTNRFGKESVEAQLAFVKNSHPLLSKWAIIFYIVIFISLIFLYNIYHQLQLTKHKDIAKRESKLSSELRQLSVHLQNAREEERASVARELHDELAQILVAIKLEISWIQSTLERDKAPNVLTRMPEIQGIVDTCVTSVRNIAMGLRPTILDDMGLLPALNWYVSNVSKRANLRLSFSTNCETINLSKELSINIYRIVQETVTNVIKHANASKLSVSCYLKENIFHLRIKDNGVGIDGLDMEKQGHYGLIGIRERVATYNGTVTISSNNSVGTVIDVTLSVEDDLLENFPSPDLNKTIKEYNEI